MAVTKETRNLIDKSKFEDLEDSWLAEMAERPDDIDYFVGIARALIGTAESDRARLLLQMLDAHYQEKERWYWRRELLREAGSLMYPEHEELHGEILATLRGIHGEAPSFDEFVQAVRLDKGTSDIPKTWEKVERLETLVPFDVGSAVFMKGKGAGKVTDVNLGLDSLKVDFERHPGLTVGFRAAAKLLEPLPKNHVLRKKMDDPEGLKALAEDDPSGLLAIVLQSYAKPRTAGEVKEDLVGIVPPKKWTSWWGKARKHPQVDVRGKGARQSYTWLGSEEQVADAVWDRFAQADPRKKLALLKREGDRDEDLFRRMTDDLRRLGAATAPTDPGLAFEIWHALDKAGAAPERSDGEVIWSPRMLFGADDLQTAEHHDVAADPLSVVRGIEDKGTREAAYNAIRELREDWPRLFGILVTREEDSKLLDQLASALEGSDEAQRLWRFVDTTIGQPHKNPPGFTWIVERAAEDESVRTRNPLRLLQQIFTAILDQRFVPFRQRLLGHVESGGTAPRLLGHLSQNQARQAEEVIERAAGLELYQRDALTNALHLKFPDLHQEQQEIIYSTPEAIASKREELRELVQEELPANRQAIEEARAMGDLRENFEYKSARQRHEYLSSRQAKLERELEIARPLDPSKVATSEVRIGTKVTLSTSDGGDGGDGGDGDRTYTLLGPWDSDPEAGILAYESDLAEKLLGKTVGDTVDIPGADGEITAKIEKIEPYA